VILKTLLIKEKLLKIHFIEDTPIYGGVTQNNCGVYYYCYQCKVWVTNGYTKCHFI